MRYSNQAWNGGCVGQHSSPAHSEHFAGRERHNRLQPKDVRGVLHALYQSHCSAQHCLPAATVRSCPSQAVLHRTPSHLANDVLEGEQLFTQVEVCNVAHALKGTGHLHTIRQQPLQGHRCVVEVSW